MCTDCLCHLDMKRHPLGCLGRDFGDGTCHDECNTKDFDYDKLDCCAEYIDDIICHDCICHLDGVRRLPECLPRHQGNSFCTDHCNNRDFKFDDHDCCLEEISDRDCQDCTCHLDGSKHPTTTCPKAAIRDGVCQDECNTEEFEFDGFECCLSNIVDSDCVACTCHLDLTPPPSVCHKRVFLEDSICNDPCNVKPFNYDGGDCCLPFIQDYSCEDCICHEDGQRHPTGILICTF